MELSSLHAHFIYEHLSNHASIWKRLGVALGFKKENLDNIEACLPLLSDSPYSFMQRLVEEWLEGKYPHLKPPTLFDLLLALRSYTVGLGKLATTIEDLLPLSTDVKVFDIADEALIIEVSENTHLHLKVKINTGDQNCVWSCKGSVPMDNSNEPALCIPKACIDMDGSLCSCEILNMQSKESFTTPVVTLRVSCPWLDRFKESLASLYLVQPVVPEDSWPPVSSKRYTNLALIKQQEMDYGEEYVRTTVRGDVDDIINHKKIEYENIFDELRSGSLFLIEGRPGSGKTTFIHKITRDWAASEVQGPMRLLLLISLRMLNNWERPVNLEDILELLDVQACEKIIKDQKGKGVCFMFDGLDEFSPFEDQRSIVYKIIEKKYLPQSVVIVASRPAALTGFRQQANRIIEVIGFQKDQIFEYVKYYPFSDSSKVEQLQSYLLAHPKVLHMCYLPIHAAMVAFLFKVMGKKIPRTETEMYRHFTHFTLMRSLSKHKGNDRLGNMDTTKLSGEEKELFDTICKFALEKTIEKKQVLDQDEMKVHLEGKNCKDVSLGLVTVDRTAGLYGYKNIYTFLHLTYQEYLAAYYISTLNDEDQHKLIRQYGHLDHMQVVWKFYCGLVDFRGHEYKIQALISDKSQIDLFEIQCAYESQQEIVCNFFMEKMDAQIALLNKILTTTDFTALGYLLANCSSTPISLFFTECSMTLEDVRVLLKETDGKPFHLHTFHYESNQIGKYDLEILALLLSQQHNLKYLKITSHHKASLQATLDDYGFWHTVKTLLPNLKELSLKNIPVGPKALSRIPELCKELTSVSLNGSCIENFDDIGPLLEWECEKLKVSCNYYTSNGMCYVNITNTGIEIDNYVNKEHCVLYVQGIRGNCLQTITLKIDYKSSDSHELHSYWPHPIKLFGLHHSTLQSQLPEQLSGLETLILRNVEIGFKNRFIEKLSHCAVLQELQLIQIELKIATIANGLKSCSNLQKLIIVNKKGIKEKDIDEFALSFKHWPKLQKLHLKDCSIKGAEPIVRATKKNCPKLTDVDLGKNISKKTLHSMFEFSLPSLHNNITQSSLQSQSEATKPNLSKSQSQRHDKIISETSRALGIGIKGTITKETRGDIRTGTRERIRGTQAASVTKETRGTVRTESTGTRAGTTSRIREIQGIPGARETKQTRRTKLVDEATRETRKKTVTRETQRITGTRDTRTTETKTNQGAGAREIKTTGTQRIGGTGDTNIRTSRTTRTRGTRKEFQGIIGTRGEIQRTTGTTRDTKITRTRVTKRTSETTTKGTKLQETSELKEGQEGQGTRRTKGSPEANSQ